MDWSKTKTIFIITFFILDIFLGIQFMEKRDSNQLSVITEASIEEQLEVEGITYVELPNETIKETYISAKSKQFVKKDLETADNQEYLIESPTVLIASLKKPVPISEPNALNEVNQFLKQHVYAGGSYIFWKWDKERRILTFSQQYNGKTIYRNGSGMLLLQLNDKDEIIGYRQTFLENIEQFHEEQELMPAIKALESLYNNGDLFQGDHVSNIEIGYYTLVPLTESQILTPTWHIVVNEEEDYYVNAFEGQIIRTETRTME